MSRYAANTEVGTDRSRAEIERTLSRYGADQFMYGWAGSDFILGFRAHGRMVRFKLVMPSKSEYRLTPTGRRRAETQMHTEWEQAVKQRWRAMALWIKATLEAIESGFISFEDAFLANTVMPNGQVVSTLLQPQIEQAYDSGDMPQGFLPQLTTGA